MNLNFGFILVCLFVLLFSGEILAQSSFSDDSSSEEPFSENSKKLNIFINRLLKNYLYFEEKVIQKNNSETFAEDKIESKELKRFNYQNNRGLKNNFSRGGSGALVRVLDKIYGTYDDILLPNEEKKNYDQIEIEAKLCLFKKGSPNDGITLIYFKDTSPKNSMYQGWLSSKRSNLANFEHYRYRFWLLRCIMSDQE